MNDIREIVTRTVTGKGRKIFNVKVDLTGLNDVTSVLGCWIINHTFTTSLVDNTVMVKGSFESNVWYASEDNSRTDVSKLNTEYEGKICIRKIASDCISDHLDVIARVISQPTCVNASITDNSINLDVTFEILVEVIGDAKIVVNTVTLPPCNDQYDDFENEINEDFLKEGN